MDYIANPVRVTALQIVNVESYSFSDDARLHLEDGTAHVANAGMTARYKPVPGDYLVTQEDGYVYINPREVFERKYHPAGSKVSFVQDREIASFLNSVGDKAVERGAKAEMAVVIYGTYGGNFYVESCNSGVEALGIMEIGKATMMNAIMKTTFDTEQP